MWRNLRRSVPVGAAFLGLSYQRLLECASQQLERDPRKKYMQETPHEVHAYKNNLNGISEILAAFSIQRTPSFLAKAIIPIVFRNYPPCACSSHISAFLEACLCHENEDVWLIAISCMPSSVWRWMCASQDSGAAAATRARLARALLAGMRMRGLGSSQLGILEGLQSPGAASVGEDIAANPLAGVGVLDGLAVLSRSVCLYLHSYATEYSATSQTRIVKACADLALSVAYQEPLTALLHARRSTAGATDPLLALSANWASDALDSQPLLLGAQISLTVLENVCRDINRRLPSLSDTSRKRLEGVLQAQGGRIATSANQLWQAADSANTGMEALERIAGGCDSLTLSPLTRLTLQGLALQAACGFKLSSMLAQAAFSIPGLNTSHRMQESICSLGRHMTISFLRMGLSTSHPLANCTYSGTGNARGPPTFNIVVGCRSVGFTAAAQCFKCLAGPLHANTKFNDETELYWVRAATTAAELCARTYTPSPLGDARTSLELRLGDSGPLQEPFISQVSHGLATGPAKNLSRASYAFLTRTLDPSSREQGAVRHLLASIAGLTDQFLVEAAAVAHDPALASQRLLLTSTAQAIVDELQLARDYLDQPSAQAKESSSAKLWRMDYLLPSCTCDSEASLEAVLAPWPPADHLGPGELVSRIAVSDATRTSKLSGSENTWLDTVVSRFSNAQDPLKAALSVKIYSPAGQVIGEPDARGGRTYMENGRPAAGRNEQHAPAWMRIYRRLSRPLAYSIADEISYIRWSLWQAVGFIESHSESTAAKLAVSQACAFATSEVPPVMLESHDDSFHRVSHSVVTDDHISSAEAYAGGTTATMNTNTPVSASKSVPRLDRDVEWRASARKAMRYTHTLVECSRSSLLASGCLSSAITVATSKLAYERSCGTVRATSQSAQARLSASDIEGETRISRLSTIGSLAALEMVQTALVRTVANLALHDDHAAVLEALSPDSVGSGQSSHGLEQLLLHLGESDNLRLRTQLVRAISNVSAAQAEDMTGYAPRHPFAYSFPTHGSPRLQTQSETRFKEKFGDMVHPLLDWRGREGSKYAIDIVLVHGLRGDPYTTWRAGRSDDPGAASIPGGPVVNAPHDGRLVDPGSYIRLENGLYGPIWPVAWLAPELYQSFSIGARVLSIGFDADPFARIIRSRDASVPELAAQLEEQLELAGVGRNGRPVVFLTHSLGGLLMKHVLTRPWGLLDGHKNYSDCDYQSRNAEGYRDHSPVAVVFYGTPHRGSPVGYANILPIASPVVQHLHEGSNLLADLDARFLSACQQQSSAHTDAGDNYAAGLLHTTAGPVTRLSQANVVGCGCAIEEMAEDIHVGLPALVVVPARSARLDQCRSVQVPTRHAHVCKPVRGDHHDPRYYLATDAARDIIRFIKNEDLKRPYYA